MTKRLIVSKSVRGAHVTKREYDLMLASYAEHGSITRAAKDAGVAMSTARKYIYQGSAAYPAICDRITKIQEREREIEDADLLSRRRLFKNGITDAAERVIEKLGSTEINLSGSFVMDPSTGEPKLGADGTPLVAIDEGTLKSVVTVLRDMYSLLSDVDRKESAQQPAAGNTLNLSVGVTLTPDIVRKEAISSLSACRFSPTIQNAEFEEVVAKEALRRVGNDDADTPS